MEAYDQIYDWYIQTRSATIGVSDVTRALSGLPRGGIILDVGCGSGLPLVAVMQQLGFVVIGVDSSLRMGEVFRENFPGYRFYHMPIEDYPLSANSLDGAISWGCLFHLRPAVQEAVLTRLAGAIRPGGRLLFTAAQMAGQTTNKMAEITFHYYSLGSQKYHELLENRGMSCLAEYADPHENDCYLFQKNPITQP